MNIDKGLIYDLVIETRKEIFKEHDSFIGLCNHACLILKDKIEKYNKENNLDIEVFIIHGELKHTMTINPDDWFIEHTWLKIRFVNVYLYVDPTSSQLKDIFPSIPNFYISYDEPEWYLPDSENIIYNKLSKKFKIIFHLISYYQYYIKRNIYKCIRFIKSKLH